MSDTVVNLLIALLLLAANAFLRGCGIRGW